MTVSRSTSAYSWKIIPISRRALRRAAEPSFARSVSSSITAPLVGSTRRLMQRIMVDLPAPDGPINARTCPLGTSRSIAFSA